jgi:hypothetical protein
MKKNDHETTKAKEKLPLLGYDNLHNAAGPMSASKF